MRSGEIVKTVAVIVAGGTGKRMGHDSAKQYLMLGAIPIIVHTLRAFEKASLVHDIVLVVPAHDIDYVKISVVELYGISKVKHIISGGAKRQDSVKNGLEAVSNDCSVVVIHDGVRPFVSAELINTSVMKAIEAGAVTVGVPVKDTVKSVTGDGIVKETLDRQELWLTQTPQTFTREIIQQAYRRAYEDNFYGTDEASLVERMNVKIIMMNGSYENIKITTPEDLALGEFILKKRGVIS
ncbi:MAG: 2-C-methyl-D-erythritol 4-phosphate cytidylyltransferase [Deltaproteobacteria bacterium]|nr:2-C-methyl-D-erythritol 4-phosphate cytidylyltransferase [Deltaproteobacteria bacterium]